MEVIRTWYVVEMYWAGRDVLVSDILSQGYGEAGIISPELLIDKCMDLICWRLDRLLGELRKVRELQGVVGCLDADYSMYVKERGREVGKGRMKIKEEVWGISGGGGKKGKGEGGKKTAEEGGGNNLPGTHNLILHVLRYNNKISQRQKTAKGTTENVGGGEMAHGLSIMSSSLMEAIREVGDKALGSGGKQKRGKG